MEADFVCWETWASLGLPLTPELRSWKAGSAIWLQGGVVHPCCGGPGVFKGGGQGELLFGVRL